MLMDGPAAVARLGMRYMNPDRAIDVLAKRRARSPADEIAATLRRLADHHYWSPPPRGDRGPLADVLVHSGDIRIALGLPFEPDPQLAAVAIDRRTQPTTTGLVPLGRLRRISWRATDINRTWRKGEEIRGPVSALMMAVGGRTALLDVLDGPGLPLAAAATIRLGRAPVPFSRCGVCGRMGLKRSWSQFGPSAAVNVRVNSLAGEQLSSL